MHISGRGIVYTRAEEYALKLLRLLQINRLSKEIVIAQSGMLGLELPDKKSQLHLRAYQTGDL